MTKPSAMAEWTLALDQGSHATRALVFDAAGHERLRVEEPVLTHRPREGWVEHEAEALWASLETCLARVTQKLGGDVARLGSAALCTQRSSVVCWSRADGRALSPVLSWQDVRAADRLVATGLDHAIVRAVTGLRLSPHYGASKLAWCFDNLPPVAAAAARGDLAMGPLAAWLVFRLSGGATFAVDPCNASRTLLWDLTTRDWSPHLLKAFGVPRAVLPECRPNRSLWSTLRLDGHEVPLVIVTGDQSAVPFAFEAERPDTAYLTLGTGAFLQRLEEDGEDSCTALLRSVVWQDGAKVLHALEGTVNGAGAALAWLAREEHREEAELLAHLPDWFTVVPDPPLFINAVGGLAAPFWRPEARSWFAGEGDVRAKTVAVVESIAFLVQANLDAMRACRRPCGGIVAVGGLARLAGLLQRIATLSGLAVRSPDVREATAYGGARLANPALPPLALTHAAFPDVAAVGMLRRRYRTWREHIATA
ncbi:MAG TPA: FGGY family carbohydrate kinase [Gammaproteobacteria bacterium]|nr:FGGY family carbohydrate kinase [Gammaproteobacteria bacterium]